MNSERENRKTSKDRLLVIAVLLACLLPFIGKAVHIDDPLFVWTAQHIISEPFDFYHFTVNWGGQLLPMSEVTKNPPLASYLLAGIGYLFGWKETILHLALLIPAIGTALGTYALARRWSARPARATIIGILTPVFIISGTTLMCDMLMLCFWVWAIEFWVSGLESRNQLYFAVSVLLCSAAALTKYYGAALIPLLVVYTILIRHKPEISLAWMLIPAAILAGYQFITLRLYGRGLLLDAVSYATDVGAFGQSQFLFRIWTGFAFTGGCFLTIAVIRGFLESWKRIAAVWLPLVVVLFVLYTEFPTLGPFIHPDRPAYESAILVQIAIMVIAGIGITLMIVLGLRNRSDPAEILLVLWLGGTFLFAASLNWTCNGRSLLPMAPAIGILTIRRIDKPQRPDPIHRRKRELAAILISGVVALLAAGADYSQAESAKEAAVYYTRDSRPGGHTLWFQGHWGFQYYMQKGGAVPLEAAKSALQPGDQVIIPMNNTALIALPELPAPTSSVENFRVLPWLTCMHYGIAGFYSDIWGPLPFAFGNNFTETYHTITVKYPIQLTP